MMGRRILFNAALIPHAGTWRYTDITAQQVACWLRDGAFESFVGY